MSPEDLIKEAIIAQGRAKAKYSNFHGGSALLTKNNQIIHLGKPKRGLDFLLSQFI